MPKIRRYLPLLLVASLIAMSGAGCSREARKNRHLARANGYFQSGDDERAEIEHMNVVRLEPQHPVAIPRLGLVCFEQRRLAGAVALPRKAEKLEPEHLDVGSKMCMAQFGRDGLTVSGVGAFSSLRD